MIAALILAAGGSSRLGQPKQLLRYRGRTLVRNVAQAALDAGCRPVLVVLGAAADEVGSELNDLDVQVVLNTNWHEGMAASIRCGVQALPRGEQAIEAVVLTVCDQPLLSATVLRRVCAAYDGAPGRRVACEYAGTVGVPALFERSLFDELLALQGDTGAKSLLQAAGADLIRVSWPEGAIEVDRPGDLKRLE
jgi:molybdenum cofactor cytidylyltransferase